MGFTSNGPEMPEIGIAGLGLIGGSLAKAFKTAGCAVAACDIDSRAVRAALESGAADSASVSPEALSGADYIFVALYPDDAVSFVKRNFLIFKKGAAVVDCCGIKSRVCEELDPFSRRNGFLFIGGHPMAGTEKSGFSAASAELFRGASFILTPRSDIPSGVIESLDGLLRLAGFGGITVTTPQNHDRMIAFTSQLPHVLACAYVQSPNCPEHGGFSAGSFQDVSRVAHINAPMWAELFIENREALCREIDSISARIREIRDAAASCDYEKLNVLLQKARDIKDRV